MTEYYRLEMSCVHCGQPLSAMPTIKQIYDHWRVLSDDGHELTGPMTEKDARAFLGLLEAVGNTLEDFGANGPFSITLPVRLGELRTAYQAATGRTA